MPSDVVTQNNFGRELRRLEGDSWAIYLSGKFFLMNHGRKISLRWQGNVRVNPEDRFRCYDTPLVRIEAVRAFRTYAAILVPFDIVTLIELQESLRRAHMTA